MTVVLSYVDDVGYVYLLNNHRVPNIVKIGYTNRTPEERALELRGTGVPGSWEVKHKWKIPNAYHWEQRIHNELNEFRTEREFFELALEDAKNFIHQYLVSNKVIGEDGLTESEREYQNARLRLIAEEAIKKSKAEEFNRLKIAWESHKADQWEATKRETFKILAEDGFDLAMMAPKEPIRPTGPEVFSLDEISLDNIGVSLGALTAVALGIAGYINGLSASMCLTIGGLGVLGFAMSLQSFKTIDPQVLQAFRLEKEKYNVEKSAFDVKQAKVNKEFKDLSNRIYAMRFDYFVENNGVPMPLTDQLVSMLIE